MRISDWSSDVCSSDLERLAANLFGLAWEKGFSAHDELKVGFNRRTAGYEAGELVFVYREGGNVSPDPYANRAHMSTSAALEDPADEIYRRIGAEVRTQRQAPMLAQQPDATEEKPTPTRSIPPHFQRVKADTTPTPSLQ